MELQRNSFIALLAFVTVAFVALIADFVMPVFWAAILAIIFHPVFAQCQRWLPGRNSIAALLTILVICITVLLPLWFVLAAFVTEATGLYERTQAGQFGIAETLTWIQTNVPLIPELLNKVGISFAELKSMISETVISSSQYIGFTAITAGQGAVRFAALFFLMLYVLFFFLRDGDALKESIVHALPLGDIRERALMAKFAEVSRATVKGTLIIGIVQGTLGGVIFAVLGIQGAVFWGTMMVILSLIPVVGAGLVWAPAALVFIINGDYFSATILVLFGVLVIGLADNLLRPILVGRDTRMPDYLVLLSTLGGLTMFGASGIVIGPVIAALFLTVWVMFAKEFNDTEGALLYEGDHLAERQTGMGADDASD